MATPHLLTHLVVSYKLLREPKVLVQTNFTLVSFGNCGLIRLNRTVPSSKQCPNMLCRRRWRKRPLKDPQGGGTHAWIGWRVLETTRQWTWAVKGEFWGFGGLGVGRKLAITGNYKVLGLCLRVFNGFSLTESHGIKTKKRELEEWQRK